MKHLLTVLIAALFLMACNNEKKTESTDKDEAKNEQATMAYPYKAAYSSDFSMGNPNHVKTVLDLYKMWEDNKLEEMKTLLADTVSIDFSDGFKVKDITADSMINFARQFRSALSSVKVMFDAWMPVHVNDTKEDYVLVWSRDYNTDMSGKVDSLSMHAYFLIKDNKIRSWSEFNQKLAAPPPMQAK